MNTNQPAVAVKKPRGSALLHNLLARNTALFGLDVYVVTGIELDPKLRVQNAALNVEFTPTDLAELDALF